MTQISCSDQVRDASRRYDRNGSGPCPFPSTQRVAAARHDHALGPGSPSTGLFFTRARRSRCGIAPRVHARMRFHIQVRIAAAMPGIVDLLARRQIGRRGLARGSRGGDRGAGTCRCATREQRDDQDCDQGEANGGTMQFSVRNEGLNDAVRARCCWRDRHERRRRGRPAAGFMFRFPLIAPMTRT
ncbi:hypothetical protein BURCENK562V_C2716 [Burkholderia cenocepacia K56-2Valvano]|nr:hypothetical protein BURCENK562V_C2716 [Burkholderia cenocepacia K56-2Valvano]